jgi:hypothetical protein
VDDIGVCQCRDDSTTVRCIVQGYVIWLGRRNGRLDDRGPSAEAVMDAVEVSLEALLEDLPLLAGDGLAVLPPLLGRETLIGTGLAVAQLACALVVVIGHGYRVAVAASNDAQPRLE